MLRKILAPALTFAGIMFMFFFWYKVIPLEARFVEWQRDPWKVWQMMAGWAVVGGLSCFLMARHIADWAMKVDLLTPEHSDPDLEKAKLALDQAQERLKLVRTPELGIFNGEEINAYIVGPRLQNSTLALSRGAVQKLSLEELEILISRELLHHRSGDLRALALMQGMLFAFTLYVARMLAFLLGTSLRQTEEEQTSSQGVEMVVTCALLVVLTLPGAVVFWLFSRSSALRADEAVVGVFGRSAYATFLSNLTPHHPPRSEIFSDVFKLQSQTFPRWLRGLSLQPALDSRMRLVQGLSDKTL
ncbi:M48 family metalloprotease [Oligoflexus tunisiensis]|uniref:M48 family metalloprotease n=1 Tax=Oligoflexus tunisiensis TaxID=708132 RepID=UPI00114CA7B1|nr:M48 family metalloprotease [Oligoflexus tunisiensis]